MMRELLLPAGEIRIAFVLYKHIGVYLSTENASMKLGNEAKETNYSVIVNSAVITAAINKDSNKVYLSDPVVFTVRHLQVSSYFSVCFCRMELVFSLRFFSFDVVPLLFLGDSLFTFPCRKTKQKFHIPVTVGKHTAINVALFVNLHRHRFHL